MNDFAEQLAAKDAEIFRLNSHIEEIYRRLQLVEATSASTGTGTRVNPVVIGSPNEPPEVIPATTWAVTSGRAVDIWTSIGTAFYDAGDKVLYGYKVRARYDSAGVLYSVDTPTRYIIDTPTECG